MVSTADTRARKDKSNNFVEGTTAEEALEKGFQDLMDLCDVVADKFTAAREEHAANPLMEE
jgi:DNA-directed RNA polymerase I and III subunit RPAC2